MGSLRLSIQVHRQGLTPEGHTVDLYHHSQRGLERIKMLLRTTTIWRSIRRIRLRLKLHHKLPLPIVTHTSPLRIHSHNNCQPPHILVQRKWPMQPIHSSTPSTPLTKQRQATGSFIRLLPASLAVGLLNTQIKVPHQMHRRT